MAKILIAEDEAHLRNAIAIALKDEGYKVTECFDGKDALRAFGSEHFDLVITDVMMPRVDGNELVSAIRSSNKEVPILMLTALETIEDKTRGFESGTDDYLVKPILMKELSLRVKAMLRRGKIFSENKIELPNTTLDMTTQTLKIKGKDVELTKKEFQLLFKMLSYPNKIFSREQLLSEIWGFETDSLDRTVDTHMSWLRQKAVSPDFEIVTVRGLGYKAVVK